MINIPIKLIDGVKDSNFVMTHPRIFKNEVVRVFAKQVHIKKMEEKCKVMCTY